MSDKPNIIPHANELKNQAETYRKTIQQAVTQTLKSFVESKTQETITYINNRIQKKIKEQPDTDYILINNIDVFN